MGIDLVQTDRGGDVTYHGPGQLVAYPILRLAALGLSLGGYMRWLEQVVIATVDAFDVKAFREAGLTGVWVGRQPGQLPAKLCALGVRVARHVTMHGMALNVTTELAHFKTIVPCGLVDRPVTSLKSLLGQRTPAMGQVKAQLVEQFYRYVGQVCQQAASRRTGAAHVDNAGISACQ